MCIVLLAFQCSIPLLAIFSSSFNTDGVGAQNANIAQTSSYLCVLSHVSHVVSALLYNA